MFSHGMRRLILGSRQPGVAEMSDFLDMVCLMVALLSTQLVFTLYGAGVRRPFGHLPKIPDVPRYMWNASKAIWVADCLFAIFVFIMTISLFSRMNVFAFLFFSSTFYIFGELLTYKIRLVPSFFISLALAVLSVALVWHGGLAKLIVAAG
jgi:hypothetical protein